MSNRLKQIVVFAWHYRAIIDMLRQDYKVDQIFPANWLGVLTGRSVEICGVLEIEGWQSANTCTMAEAYEQEIELFRAQGGRRLILSWPFNMEQRRILRMWINGEADAEHFPATINHSSAQEKAKIVARPEPELSLLEIGLDSAYNPLVELVQPPAPECLKYTLNIPLFSLAESQDLAVEKKASGAENEA